MGLESGTQTRDRGCTHWVSLRKRVPGFVGVKLRICDQIETRLITIKSSLPYHAHHLCRLVQIMGLRCSNWNITLWHTASDRQSETVKLPHPLVQENAKFDARVKGHRAVL